MTKELYKRLAKHHQEAVGEFMIAMAEAIGQDTAMTLHSLLPAAYAVGVGEEVLDMDVGGDKRKGVMRPIGANSWKWSSKKYRSRAYGFNVGSYKRVFNYKQGNHRKPIFSFRFTPATWQHAYHDTALGTRSMNWQSIAAGQLAYEEYLEKNPFDLAKNWEQILDGISTG